AVDDVGFTPLRRSRCAERNQHIRHSLTAARWGSDNIGQSTDKLGDETMSDRDNPKSAIAIPKGDDAGDGGTSWVGGCAAMLALLIVGASAVIAEVVRWIA
ncbi:MAG: hypothetical protein WC683_18925, partial [bacterium]